MTLNVQKVDIGTVPINLPRGSDRKLSVRGLSKSRLIASEIRYGLTPFSGKPNFPLWSDAYSIGVALREHKSDIVVDGNHFSHRRRPSETQLLYVSGVEHVDFSTPRHGVEVLLPRSFMREITSDLEVPHVTRLGRSLCHIADDPVLRHLVLQIFPFFDSPETLEPLQADHFMWALGIYVCANYGDLVSRRSSAGMLTAWQERLAKDVIETRIVGGIGLAELAALCGLGTSQFSHAFKRSTGIAPHQWLVRRRVARARELLQSGHTHLADVALACGFADQSHLTRTFTRHLGVSPRAWQIGRAPR